MRWRYERRRRGDLAPIMVNGEVWRGPVVTVGSGKQYSNVTSINGLPDQCLVLLYPGTYTNNYWYLNSRGVHIRGMGPDPTSTIINCSDNGMCVEGNLGGSSFYSIFENLQFQGYARPFMLFNGGKGIFNRCYITHNAYSTAGAVACHWSYNQTNGQIFLRNCYISNGGSYMFSNLALSNVTVDRCQLNASPNYYSCGGSFALADYATSAKSGYGYVYGSDLITGI